MSTFVLRPWEPDSKHVFIHSSARTFTLITNNNQSLQFPIMFIFFPPAFWQEGRNTWSEEILLILKNYTLFASCSLNSKRPFMQLQDQERSATFWCHVTPTLPKSSQTRSVNDSLSLWRRAAIGSQTRQSRLSHCRAKRGRVILFVYWCPGILRSFWQISSQILTYINMMSVI